MRSEAEETEHSKSGIVESLISKKEGKGREEMKETKQETRDTQTRQKTAKVEQWII